MKKNEALIDDVVDEWFAYDPKTGAITWKVSPNRRIVKDSEAGCLNKSTGYWVTKVKGKLYYAHRLAWRLHYGVWPEGEIDHINRNPSNNSIENLRIVTRYENQMNRGMYSSNASGEPRVYRRKQKWQLQLTLDEAVGQVHFGYYSSVEQAKRMKMQIELLYSRGFSINKIKEIYSI